MLKINQSVILIRDLAPTASGVSPDVGTVGIVEDVFHVGDYPCYQVLFGHTVWVCDAESVRAADSTSLLGRE